MSWECTECGHDNNDDELIRCVCGYETGSAQIPLTDGVNVDRHQRRQSYAENWKAYRKLKKTIVIIFITYLPAGALCALINHYLFSFGAMTLIIILSWMLAFIVAAGGLITWPCPQCQNWFHLRRFHSNHFSNRCLHCGLVKWAEEDHRDAGSFTFDEIHCLNCGHAIPKDNSFCANCGWSWQEKPSPPPL